MNKLNVLSKLAIASLTIGLGVVETSESVWAGQLFDINQQTTGFVTELSGASEFGLSDEFGGPVCANCDSVVNFATYANPEMGNWVDALGVRDDLVGVGIPSPGMEVLDPNVDENAKWVFFYKIQNTNPLGGVGILENFNVTKENEKGLPVPGVQPYNSAGYINGWTTNDFDPTPGLDEPNDWQPALTEFKTIIELVNDDDGVEPDIAFGTLLDGPSPISSPSVRNGQVSYTGALFDFEGTGFIPVGEFSDLLVLTSNERYAGIVWAETESPGGFGAAADVAGIKNPVNVPEPGTVLGLLAISGLGFGLKRKKQS